jgi:hypothetical protein
MVEKVCITLSSSYGKVSDYSKEALIRKRRRLWF